MTNSRCDAVHLSHMPGKRSVAAKEENKAVLKGWKAIAEFLGQSPSVVKRWHSEGMPVYEEGRFVSAKTEELTRWIGTEHGEVRPVHIATENENLTADLKQALSYVRRGRRSA